MKYWILTEFDLTLIVSIYYSRLQPLVGQLCNQLVKKDSLTISKCSCHVSALVLLSAIASSFLLVTLHLYLAHLLKFFGCMLLLKVML